MRSPIPENLIVGGGAKARTIATVSSPGGAPGVFCLTGFTGAMETTGTTALDRLAATRDISLTRFDYSGHGISGGSFVAGTISRWLEEAEAVFDQTTTGPQIIHGVSMGGWLALHLAERDARRKATERRIHGLALMAPSLDMTQMIFDAMPDAAKTELARSGRYVNPDEPEPRNIITETLIADGARYNMIGRPITVACGVRILHGLDDESVPWQQSLDLPNRITTDDVSLTLLKGGDHALSRASDITAQTAAVDQLIEQARS